jgi:hypothetical protein
MAQRLLCIRQQGEHMKALLLTIALLALTACGQGSVDPRLAEQVSLVELALKQSCGVQVRQDINYKVKDLPGFTVGLFHYDLEDKLKSEVSIYIDTQTLNSNASNFIVHWILIHEIAHSAGLKHQSLGTGLGADLIASRTNYAQIAGINPLDNPEFLIELCNRIKDNNIKKQLITHTH